MDFSFSQEQRLLRSSLQACLRQHADFASHQRAVQAGNAWRPELWQALADQLGVLGLGLRDDSEPLADNAQNTMIVMEELGRALAIEPYLDVAIVAGYLLGQWRSAAAPALRDALCAGRAMPILAWSEAGSHNDFRQQALPAQWRDGQWILSGQKTVVMSAPLASHFIVSARTTGRAGEERGLSLFVVPAGTPGLSIDPYPTIDERCAADLLFAQVQLPDSARLGEQDQALALLEAARCHGIAALSAEAVGVMEALLQQTRDYCQQRRQFSQPLSRFQVLQHRMVDMYLQLEMSRAASYRATLSLSADVLERERSAAAAKVTVARACRFIGQNAVQLHGGMGMSDDMPVSHYFKRATAIERELGSADEQLLRYQQLAVSA